MSNELVRTKLENSLSLGSLASLVKASESVMLLLDTSGSMAGERIMSLRKVVANVKAAGHVPMIAFGGPYDAQVRFVDSVPDPDGGTPLHQAIPYAKQYGANRLVVISDGMPDLTESSLDAARAFGGQIDVVFIGHETDGGSVFLDELARITGGKRLQGDVSDIKALTSTVIGFLEGEVEAPHAPIQGPGFTAEASEELAPEEDEEFPEEEDDDEDA